MTMRGDPFVQIAREYFQNYPELARTEANMFPGYGTAVTLSKVTIYPSAVVGIGESAAGWAILYTVSGPIEVPTVTPAQAAEVIGIRTDELRKAEEQKREAQRLERERQVEAAREGFRNDVRNWIGEDHAEVPDAQVRESAKKWEATVMSPSGEHYHGHWYLDAAGEMQRLGYDQVDRYTDGHASRVWLPVEQAVALKVENQARVDAVAQARFEADERQQAERWALALPKIITMLQSAGPQGQTISNLAKALSVTYGIMVYPTTLDQFMRADPARFKFIRTGRYALCEGVQS